MQLSVRLTDQLHFSEVSVKRGQQTVIRVFTVMLIGIYFVRKLQLFLLNLAQSVYSIFC